MTDLVLVLTTISEDRAAEVATKLVEERLAACVNVHGPMKSTYWWKGRIEIEVEQQLVIKTVRAKLVALQKRVHELHPYELPEFVVISAEQVSDRYLVWVRDQTALS